MYGLLLAARLLYLPGGLLVYCVGVALGRGGGAPGAIACGALVVVLVHVLTHFVNDAEDVVTDERTAAPTAFYGGSRAIQRGLVTPRRLLRASLWLAAAVAGLAGLLVAFGDWGGAGLALAMMGLGYAYSGRPFTLGRRGLGEVDAALVMGVLVPLAGAHAAGGVTPTLWAVLPVFFFEIVLGRLCTAYPDLAADRDTGKRTLPVILGPRGSAAGFGLAAVLIAVLGQWTAAALPHPTWQRAATLVVALSGFGLAWLVGSGQAERRPTLLPMIGFPACGVHLFVLWASTIL